MVCYPQENARGAGTKERLFLTADPRERRLSAADLLNGSLETAAP